MFTTATATKIATTKDYNLFSRLKGNRKEYPAHVRKLRESILRNPELLPLRPILVNDRMEVIDGQNRLKICEEQGLPVYFQRAGDMGLEQVQLINSTSKPWVPMDYARSFAELGMKPYIQYIRLHDIYGFNHEIIMNYLSLESPCTTETFRIGKLNSPDVEKSEALLAQLKEIGNYYSRHHTRHFATAFLAIATNIEYEHDRMISQLRKYSTRLVDHALPKEYQINLEEIYNFSLSRAKRQRLYQP